jgi:hypothetical protein
MKKLILAFLITAPFFLNSCAMLMRKRMTGDLKSGFNLVTKSSKPIIVSLDGKELKSKLFFDGTSANSDFKVYKYYLPHMSKEVNISINAFDMTKKVTLYREKEKGWFWVDGAVVWFYEAATGKYFYYNDVNVDELFTKK